MLQRTTINDVKNSLANKMVEVAKKRIEKFPDDKELILSITTEYLKLIDTEISGMRRK